MSARRTIERILQDGDDRQTQRSWAFQADGNHITIKDRVDGPFLGLLIRAADIPQFVADLQELAPTPKGDTDHER